MSATVRLRQWWRRRQGSVILLAAALMPAAITSGCSGSSSAPAGPDHASSGVSPKLSSEIQVVRDRFYRGEAIPEGDWAIVSAALRSSDVRTRMYAEEQLVVDASRSDRAADMIPIERDMIRSAVPEERAYGAMGIVLARASGWREVLNAAKRDPSPAVRHTASTLELVAGRVGKEKPLISGAGVTGTQAGGLAAALQPWAERFKERYGVDLIAGRNVGSRWRLRYDPLDSQYGVSAIQCAALLYAELGLYTADYRRRLGLREIVLCRGLEAGDIPVATVADPQRGLLFFDCVGASVGGSVEESHLFHHELFHLLVGSVEGDMGWVPWDWTLLNPPGFSYGKGPAEHRSAAEGRLDHPSPGFVDNYAKSGPAEDLAEIAACTMVPAEAAMLEKWRRADPYLDRKCRRFATLVAGLLAKPVQRNPEGWWANNGRGEPIEMKKR